MRRPDSKVSKDFARLIEPAKRALTLSARRLEPVASVGNPPRGENDRDGGHAGPPERKQKIGHQPEQHENHPEYLFLHRSDSNRRANGSGRYAQKPLIPKLWLRFRSFGAQSVFQVRQTATFFPTASPHNLHKASSSCALSHRQFLTAIPQISK